MREFSYEKLQEITNLYNCNRSSECSDFPRTVLEHGAMYVPYLMNGEQYYTLITSMFLHFGFSHLMNNMVMLLVIGYSLEPEIGKIRFLIIYLGSGLMGNLVSAWFDVSQGSYAVSAGASGAIFGIVGALLYVVVRNHGRVGEISTRGLVLMAGLSIYYGFTAQGVDNAAHIGGLVSGFLLAVLTYWKRKPKHYKKMF